MKTRSALTLLVLSLAGALAWADAGDLQLRGNHTRMLERLNAASESAYADILAWYDEALNGAPYDVVTAVERCRFVRGVAHDEVHPHEAAAAEHERCLEGLSQRFAGHPEVALFELEQRYGEELIEAGRALAGEQPIGGWTWEHLARLHGMLARAYDGVGKADLAGHHALEALRYDAGADTRLIAARWQIAAGEESRARATLTSPLATWGEADWETAQRFALLALAGARDEAVAVYRTLRGRQPQQYDRVTVARSLASLGAIAEAREEFRQLGGEHWRAAYGTRELLLFELQHGTPAEALSAYEKLRDFGFSEDPLLHLRSAVALRDLSLPWQGRDLLGALAAFGTLSMAAFIALLMVVPVHYRGMARRLAGAQPHPYSGGWQLRHAWLVFFGFGISIVLSSYLAGGVVLGSGDAPVWALAVEDHAALARMNVVFIALLLLVAAALALGAPGRRVAWTTNWSLRKATAVGIGLGVALRVILFLALLAGLLNVEGAREFWNRAHPELVAIRDHFGAATVIVLTVLAAPVIEEFLFRGVLLAAFSRHLAFGAANALQATIFALLHLEPLLIPFLFVLGLVAGTLARRSGGLLAPMLLHGVSNLMTMLVFLWQTP